MGRSAKVVWIFGSSAVGKFTLIKDLIKHPDYPLHKTLGTKTPMGFWQSVKVSPDRDTRVRLRLEGVQELTQTGRDVLIHRQFVDLPDNLKAVGGKPYILTVTREQYATRTTSRHGKPRDYFRYEAALRRLKKALLQAVHIPAPERFRHGTSLRDQAREPQRAATLQPALYRDSLARGNGYRRWVHSAMGSRGAFT